MVLIGVGAITFGVLLAPFGLIATALGCLAGGFAAHGFHARLKHNLGRDALLQRGLFRIAGFIAKRSGRILPEHIAAAQKLIKHLDLSVRDQKNAVASFNEGKAITEVDSAAYRLKARAPMFLRAYVAWQLIRMTRVAPQSLAAESALRNVVEILGLPKGTVGLVRTPAWVVPDVQPRENAAETPYDILGVAAGTQGPALKQAYRQAMSRHHPDKIAAAGGSEAEIHAAKEESQKIQQAWQLLKKRAAR